MAKKLETIADLAKAFSGLSGHFKKMAALHGALHEHHDALGKRHAARAEMIKAMVDGMDDAHEHKAYFSKAHEHHLAKASHHATVAGLHKDASVHHDALFDEMHGDKVVDDKTRKAASAEKLPAEGKEQLEKAAGNRIEEMVQTTTEKVLEKALLTITEGGSIEKMVEQIVLAKVNEALGNKIMPTEVKGVIPTVPAFAVPPFTMVPRPGQLEKVAEDAEFPVELAHFNGE